MAVIPETRATFTSTIWNDSAKGSHSTNASRMGGPNVNIYEGSKIRFGDSVLVWDVLRVFDDGTLFLSAVSMGTKMTRKVTPTDSSWTNVWMVDGRRLRLENPSDMVPELPRGGGPNRTIDPGNVVTLGISPIRWIVIDVARDGSLSLQTYNGVKVVDTVVSPKSQLWNSVYVINA